MIDFTWKYQRITDVNGNWIYVYACPITKLIEVSEILSYLSVIFQKVDVSLDQLLNAEKEYKLGVEALISKVLMAHNLTIEQLDSETLKQLFVKPGYLYSINGFSNSSDRTQESQDTQEQVSLFEFESKLITRLIDTKMARNLKQAIAIADSMPHDKLRAYINARFTQLDPEFEKKEKEKEETKKMMASFAEEFKSGTFFQSQGSILLDNLSGNIAL